MLPLGNDQRWLFIGDSITDCGRRDDSLGLGSGYVKLIRDWLLAAHLAKTPTILNRGVGGDRVLELADRWQRDVIDENPHVVSIKIGINDVWRQIDHKAPGVPIEQFVSTYDTLLADLVKAHPKVRLVLCEPSVISPPAAAEGNRMLLPYVMAVRELATKYHDHVECHIPLHGVCIEAEAKRPDILWWADGVHPSAAGHMLLARTWLSETGLL